MCTCGLSQPPPLPTSTSEQNQFRPLVL
jgi:hypothetical protein